MFYYISISTVALSGSGWIVAAWENGSIGKSVQHGKANQDLSFLITLVFPRFHKAALDGK